MNGVGGGESAEFGAPGEDVKQGVVHLGDQHLVQFGAEGGHIVQAGVGLVLQGKDQAGVIADGFDVAFEGGGAAADGGGLFGVGLLQFGQPRPEIILRGGDFLPDAFHFLGGGGGGEAGGGGDQFAAVLGDVKGGGHFGNAFLVDPFLRGGDLRKTEPADETGGDGQPHGHAKSPV